ncbi:MAG: hypothetical protein JWM10_4134 [Myxococcaceae bacterium]|nr:hypothetical protein [Myxococcaceae bacterium]
MHSTPRRFALALSLLGACSEPGTAPPDDAAARSSATLTVGAAGGSVVLGGALLTVPAGALAQPTTITVTRTELAAPAGYVLASARYRFEPAGLTFARPAQVILPLTGSAAAPAIYWSRAGDAGYERLATTLTATAASAQVTHFSEGFAGTELADGGSSDAAVPMDTAPDASAALDAADVVDVPVIPDSPVVLDVPVIPDVPFVADAPTATLIAPRPLAPLSMAAVTTARPTLRWAPAASTDGARVQICRDRACATVERTFDATGSAAAVPGDLPPGVHFWSLRARQGATLGLASSPVWSFVVGHRSAAIDTTTTTSADFDGDGYADFVVGAPRTDSIAGRVYVFAGASATTASPAPRTTIPGPDGRQYGFGSVLVPAGDVNGDGYGDLVVATSEGVAGVPNRIYVFHGASGGLPTAPTTRIDLPTPAIAQSNGNVLAAAGDVNGDGYADLVVGSTPTVVTAAATRAYVYLGSAAGLPTAASQTLTSPDATAHFGAGVAGVGDLNGDGRADVVVTAPHVFTAAPGDVGQNHAFVYFGAAAGLPSSPSADLIASAGRDEAVELAVAPLGDVDGDGRADFAVTGTPGAASSRTVHVFVGGATLATAPARSYAFDSAITPPVAAGDVNGDGYADMLVGVPRYATSPTDLAVGRALLYLGGAAGLPADPGLTIASPVAVRGTYFGITAAGFGDGNGDGFADLVIGSVESDSIGRVSVFRGGAAGLVVTPAFERRGIDAVNTFFGRFVAVRALLRSTLRS